MSNKKEMTMKNCFEGMSEPLKGALLMASGFVLLLHTLGILQRFLGYILVIIALALMVIGFMKAGGVEAVKRITKKETKESK